MPARKPEERALIARLAAATRWAGEADRTAATEKMRTVRRAQFEQQALALCPGQQPDEVARRADDLQRAHMLRMTLKARQARRRIRENTTEAEAAEDDLRDFGGGAA